MHKYFREFKINNKIENIVNIRGIANHWLLVKRHDSTEFNKRQRVSAQIKKFYTEIDQFQIFI